MKIPHDDVVARGRKTVVRRKRLADAADEYRWRSDPELAKFDASRPVSTPFDAYQRNWSFDYRFTDMAGRSFAVEDENGRHIGNVMYYNLDAARNEAEIGISIGEREYWSQGYGTDALSALAGVLMEDGVVNRLYLPRWTGTGGRRVRQGGIQRLRDVVAGQPHVHHHGAPAGQPAGRPRGSGGGQQRRILRGRVVLPKGNARESSGFVCGVLQSRALLRARSILLGQWGAGTEFVSLCLSAFSRNPFTQPCVHWNRGRAGYSSWADGQTDNLAPDFALRSRNRRGG
jgi:hypothetical protein